MGACNARSSVSSESKRSEFAMSGLKHKQNLSLGLTPALAKVRYQLTFA